MNEIILQSFEALTSTEQNKVIKQLIDSAVKLDTYTILTAIVDKVGCNETSGKLEDIITDLAY